MAMALVPLGRAPCRPSTERSVIWARGRSIPPSAFACAEARAPAGRGPSARRAARGLIDPAHDARRSWAIGDRAADAHEDSIGELEVREQATVPAIEPDGLEADDPALQGDVVRDAARVRGDSVRVARD